MHMGKTITQTTLTVFESACVCVQLCSSVNFERASDACLQFKATNYGARTYTLGSKMQQHISQ
jgi:hypothetical protein